MRKIITSLLLAAVLCGALLLTGCGMVQMDQEKDYAQTVATVNGVKILKKDFVALYEQNRAMYSQYGKTLDPDNAEDAKTIETIKTNCMDQLIQNEVVKQAVAAGGFNELTDAEKAEAKAELDAEIDEQVKANLSNIRLQHPDKTDEELMQIGRETIFDKTEYTYDTYLEEIVYAAKAHEKWEADLLKDVTVTDEDVAAQYQTLLDQQKASYEDADAGVSNYEKAMGDGTTVVYNLPGYIRVQNLLISISDEEQEQITSLRNDKKTEKADATLKAALAKIEDKAKEALKKANKKDADFEALMDEYGTDPGMKEGSPYREDGYLVGPNTTSYVAAFKEGAVALKKVGDISDLIATDYGYHIIKKIADVPAGEVALAQVADTVRESTLAQKKQSAETERIGKLVEAANVVQNKRAQKIHQYD